MKSISTQIISEAIAKLVVTTNRHVNQDVLNSLELSAESEICELPHDILNIIIDNHKIASSLKLPVCQDTGVAVFFVEIGQNVYIEGSTLEDAINDGVRIGYESGYLRKSIILDPLFNRSNTNDNTPAVIHTKIVEGDSLRIIFMAKGGGSENMSKLRMMKPSDGADGIRDFVINTVLEAGANPCPPVIVGVGIGGDFEQCAILSKKSLLRKIGDRNPNIDYANLEKEILSLINERGCGVQGLGGKTTALDVFIDYMPCHIASLPVAVNIQCHASRHGIITL